MIAEYLKTSSTVNFRFNFYGFRKDTQLAGYNGCIIARNQEIARVAGAQGARAYDLTLSFFDENITLRFPSASDNSVGTVQNIFSAIGEGIKNGSAESFINAFVSPKIFDSAGVEIGSVEIGNNDTEKITIRGRELYIYTIVTSGKVVRKSLLFRSVTRNGRIPVFCIYDAEGKMVGEIVRNSVVKNNRARYTMYFANDNDFKDMSIITGIVAWLYDGTDDGDKLNLVGRNVNTLRRKVTNDPELLARYSKEYIDAIIAREGPANLPENMSLVKQKEAESSKSPDMRFLRIGAFVAIGITILAIILLVMAFLN